MATTQNLSEDGTQTKTMESCRSTASAIQPYVYYFSIIHILLSLTAFLSNFLHIQIQDHAQQHPSQPNALNIARYRKAVYNALCVQVALLVCYLPYCILVILRTFTKISAKHLVVSEALTAVLVSFNSTLNPFIYCWKISEVRQAVKLTMRQTLCRW